MKVISRVRRRIKGAPRIEVNTVVSPADYRITLRLGDVDLIFQNPPASPAGRKERLQILGLLPYPLDHADCDTCFQFIWNHYLKKMFAASDPTLDPNTMGPGDLDRLIKESIEEFLISGGEPPAPGTFAKMRIPGDYRVLHRDFDEKFFSEPQFTLAKGNRFDVEQRFFAANPALGKIPIVAKVEVRPRSGGNWRAVRDASVFFQLREPDNLPNFVDAPGGNTVVAGALSWMESIAGATLRDSLGQTIKNVRRGNHRKKGPSGYIESYAHNRYQDPEFLTSPKKDPQRKNMFWQFGGKRYLTADTEKVHESRNHQNAELENVFVLSPVGTFYQTYPVPVDIGDAERRANPHSIVAKTNGEGEAGMIFAPSRVGGDRYKLRAFLFTPRGKKEKLDTGTMVRWRTLRISRALTVQPPDDADGLDKTIRTELSPYFGDCEHSSQSGGRYCGACLLREGKCPDINFSEMAKEHSKSFCELLVDAGAQQSFHKVVDSVTLNNALDDFARKLENNDQFAGVLDFSEPFAMPDGITKKFAGTLTAKGTIVPKHVKIRVGNETVAIDDGTGTFIETGKTAALQLMGFDLDGTVDYGSGQITINFDEPPPAGKEIFVGVKLKIALDWRNLAYHAENSPFLLNLHTPEAYNSLIDRARFAPIPSRVEDTKLIGNCDGIKDAFSINLPGKIVKCKVTADDVDISTGSEFISSLDSKSGKLDVISVAQKKEEFDFDSSAGNRFTATLGSPPERGSGQFLNIKSRIGDETKTFAFFRENLQVVVGSEKHELANLKYDENSRKIDIELNSPENEIDGFVVEYKSKSPLDNKVLKVEYESDGVYDRNNAKPAGTGPSAPGSGFLPHLTKAINWYFLIYVVRHIENNRGFMPGLMMIRSPLRDTWSAIWDSKGMHQGKGVCNGFFLFYGNQWRAGGYDMGLEAGDGTQPQTDVYPSLLLHEMSHCLYVNHFPSGVPMASGARADQHDMYDACLMGYGLHDGDFCGLCVAGFMGLKTAEPRLLTWKGSAMLRSDSEITTVADENQNQDSRVKHVEPPEISELAKPTDGDDVMSLLEACPLAKQVYDAAVSANGGIPPEIKAAAGGRGSCDPMNGDVGYALEDRMHLGDNEPLVEGATERITTGGVRTQLVSGPDIGVQILVMELSNLKHRYDFFELDARMRRGRVGHNEYIRETERIEYDGGVRNVIQSYQQCQARWKARICTKKDAMPFMNSFDRYYDEYLDPAHKENYSGVWHTEGSRSWYLSRIPRMREFTVSRLDKILEYIAKREFSQNFKLESDDHATWNLMNILFAIDPDFDSPNSEAMTFAREELTKQPQESAALDKVRAVREVAIGRFADVVIPTVT